MSLLPRSLFSRLVLVLLSGLVMAQLLSFALHMHDRGELLAQASGMRSAQRIADIVHLLDSMSAAERLKVASVISAPPLRISLERGPLAAPGAQIDSGARAAFFSNLLRNYLGEAHSVVVSMSDAPPYKNNAMHGMKMGVGSGEWTPPMMHYSYQGGGPVFVAQIRLRDGALVTFDTRQPQLTEGWPYRLLLSLSVLLAAVIVVSLIAVRWATRPLKALADAADELGKNIHRPPLQEQGPLEVVRAARAFNTMQSRLVSYLRERTQVLAAMSHDLKTPITRMRLRAELLDDAQVRAKFTHDLQELETMVALALDFLRGMENGEAVRLVDMMSLLESLQADMRETGGIVTLQGQVSEPYPGRPQALKRCLGNLIENAIKYGKTAHVVIDDNDQRLELKILDKGPGLPDAELEKVFEPFYRVEASRNRDSGGNGLGLAIAKNVIELHGGRIALSNRAGGGLEVVLALPRVDKG